MRVRAKRRRGTESPPTSLQEASPQADEGEGKAASGYGDPSYIGVEAPLVAAGGTDPDASRLGCYG